MAWLGPVMSVAAPLITGLLSGQGQNNAAGALNTQAANAYGGLVNDYQPYMGSSLSVLNNAATKGFTPQTYSAAMGRSMSAADQNIAAARNSIGSGVPNMKALSGDMFDAGIRGEADVSATLAGENQKFKTDAAGELASLGNQAISSGAGGLASLGQTYSTAASAAGNPFMNALNMLTNMGPGGSTSNGGSSFLQTLMSLFSGGGGATGAPGITPPVWNMGGAFTPGGGTMGFGG